MTRTCVQRPRNIVKRTRAEPMTGTAMILKTARTLALALLAFAVAIPAAANAATARTSSVPTVSNVAPLNIAIGDQLTITGRNFRAGKGKNTVVFKRDGQRAVFVSAEQATATQIKLTIPAKLSPVPLAPEAAAPRARRASACGSCPRASAARSPRRSCRRSSARPAPRVREPAARA